MTPLPLPRLVLLALCGLAASAAAPAPQDRAAAGAPPGATHPAPAEKLSKHLAEPPAGGFSVTYDGYAHGLIALKMQAALTLTPTAYAGRLTYHTAGFVGFMVHNESDNTVQGRFEPAGAQPLLFESHGTLRGVQRVTQISYDSDPPRILALAPPVETERSPVPTAATLHTIDTLSAIAQLIRQVGATGACDGQATTFDGRRLTHMVAHTTGPEALAQAPRGVFNGLALRCDFDGDQLAGFVKGEDRATLSRTRHGTAWVARLVPGAPPIPVQVVFTNKVLGEVTLFLTHYAATPGGAGSTRPPAAAPPGLAR